MGTLSLIVEGTTRGHYHHTQPWQSPSVFCCWPSSPVPTHQTFTTPVAAQPTERWASDGPLQESAQSATVIKPDTDAQGAAIQCRQSGATSQRTPSWPTPTAAQSCTAHPSTSKHRRQCQRRYRDRGLLGGRRRHWQQQQ